MDFQGCDLGISVVFRVLEFARKFARTLRSVAASLKACGKLNVKARDLILHTDLPMYALYIALKCVLCDEWSGIY